MPEVGALDSGHQREKLLRQQAVVRLGELALAHDDPGALFEAATETLTRLLEVELGALVEVTGDGAFQVRSIVGWQGEATSLRMAAGEGTSQASLALATRRPVVSPDLRLETRFAPSPWVTSYGARSSAMVPVVARGAPLAILAAHSRRPDAFAEADVEFMQALGNLLALAIQNRRTDEALRRSERRYRALVEGSPDAIFAHREGRVIFANGAFARLLGFDSPADAVGVEAISLVPPDRRELARQRMAAAAAAPEGTPPLVQPLLTRQGELRWVEICGMPAELEGGTAAVIVARDVSDRRAAEEALRRSERQFHTLIEQAPDAIFVMRDSVVVYANAALAAVLRRPREELVGEDASSWLAPEDRQEGLRRQQVCLREGRCPGPWVTRMRRSDGSWAILEFNSVLVDYEGKPAVAVLGRDLTDRKQLEQQLILADRMATLGTLAAGVAHEINNPLAFIGSNVTFASDELASGQPDVPEVRQALAEASDGVERVRRIVRDLKSFARPDESGDTCDVLAAVEMALKMSQHEWKHRAALERDLRPVPPVGLPESKLSQVVLNLVVNAAQALPVAEPARSRIRVRSFTDAAGHVVVEVEDNGSGIPPGAQPHVFDPFFTTKPVGVGTGLGLSVCHGIVSGAGGRLTFESTPDAGTVFRVVLPAVPARPPSRDLPVAPAPKGRKSVLVVDDDQLVGNACRRILGRRHAVTVSTDPVAALERLSEGAEYDLVLCDVMMPDLDGATLVARLRERGYDLRNFVLMSGGVSEEMRALCAALGVRWLDKPFRPGALEELLGG